MLACLQFSILPFVSIFNNFSWSAQEKQSNAGRQAGQQAQVCAYLATGSTMHSEADAFPPKLCHCVIRFTMQSIIPLPLLIVTVAVDGTLYGPAPWTWTKRAKKMMPNCWSTWRNSCSSSTDCHNFAIQAAGYTKFPCERLQQQHHVRSQPSYS